jgi:hypothetical protein
MIKIRNTPNRTLSDLCAGHCINLKKFVLRKAKKFNDENNTYSSLKIFLQQLMENDGALITKILSCEVNCFLQIHQEFSKHYVTQVEKDILQKVFDYDNFRERNSYSAYDLVKGIGLRVCPYCNRQYITVVDNGKKRPALDHFYPRCLYPLFGLSFYNLIPSCGFCNSSCKLVEDTLINKPCIHPYIEEYGESASFRYKNTIGTFETSLVITEQNSTRYCKLNNSKTLFDMDGQYKAHTDIAEELYKKSLKIPASYHRLLNASIKNIGELTSTKEEFYNFYFGNYMEESDFEKRPLAKFTTDLVKELDIMRLYDQYSTEGDV